MILGGPISIANQAAKQEITSLESLNNPKQILMNLLRYYQQGEKIEPIQIDGFLRLHRWIVRPYNRD